MKRHILHLLLFATSAALSHAQTVGQYAVPKWTSGGLSYKWLTPVNGRFFGIDGSGNPAMLSGGGGAGLDNIASTITGETLTFGGTLTAGRAITWRDLAGTVAFTSDLSSYLTSATAASTYAPIAHNQAWSTITSTPTTLAGYGITDGITAAAVTAGYQPLDSDLTSIAALTTTTHGRSLLTGADAAATRSTLGLGTLATQSGTLSDYLTTATAASTYAPLNDPTFTGAASFGGSLSAINGMTAPSVTYLGDSSGPKWEHQSATGITTSGLQLDALSTTERDGVTWYLRSSLGGTIAYLSDLDALNGSNITSGTVAAARLGSGSSITTKFLRGDNTWQTISGGGDALTSGSLDQFADVTQAATKTLAITESTTLAGGTHSGTNTGDQTTITGNAGTATALQTARTINGTSFDGTASITITAAAGTLTGSTLASGVTASSLTSVGTIASGTWQGTAIADSYISSSSTWNAKEAALTFSTGLTRSTNTITVNTSQNIATLSNLTSNGFVKTSGGTGALSIDTATYLTTTGDGSALTGITQSQVSGLATTDRASFANVRPTHSTLTYAGTTDIDLDGNGFQTVTLTGNITFTTSNRASGRCKTIRIVGDSSSRTLTWPGGWTWVGAAAPSSLAASKDAILTITAFGTADTDIVAAYAVEP